MILTPGLILASASISRQNLLKQANVAFKAQTSPVDEEIIKQTFLKDGQIEDLAMVLAQAKALSVSESQKQSLVIGADQTLLFDGRVFDKPSSIENARDQLLQLRGKTHRLETAVCVMRNSELLFSVSESNWMTMRDFSPQFLGHYLALEGENVRSSVGGYKIEGSGLQMFDKIEGDFFSILGLPMLPLLKFLRSEGIIEN